ncbi:MAG: alpha-2-macroglobulin family protein [Fusobacteriaceae bacterium]
MKKHLLKAGEYFGKLLKKIESIDYSNKKNRSILIGVAAVMLMVIIIFALNTHPKGKVFSSSSVENSNDNYEEGSPEITNTNTAQKKNIEILFAQDLKIISNADSYIKISPAVNKFKVNIDGRRIILDGDFTYGEKYVVTIATGLPFNDGTTLDKEINKTILFKDVMPEVMFSDPGVILPNSKNKKVAFTSINIKKIRVQIKKIYENNKEQFFQDFSLSNESISNGSNYNDEYYDYYGKSFNSNFKKLGDIIFDKTFKLDYSKNNWVQTEIDLEEFLEPKGLYIVELSVETKDADYSFANDSEKNTFFSRSNVKKLISLSNIGVIVEKNREGFNVIAMDIMASKPMSGATVKALSFNKQILETVSTNFDGEAFLSGNSKIFAIIVEKNGESSILKLEDNILSLDGFSIGGIISEGIKAFIYTERGVYRPGDEINLSVIARNEKSKFPGNLPIRVNVFSPTGKKFIENKVIDAGINGFYSYNLKTKTDSETGIWTVKFEIGSSEFVKNVPVETVVPNTIRLKSDLKDKIDLSKINGININFDSQYLFGAPAGNLKYKIDLSVREAEIDFEKYKNYTFKNPSNYIFSYSDSKDGSLDAQGKDSVYFSTSPFDNVATKLTGEFSIRVIQDDGRPLIQRKKVELNKVNSYVGIETPSRSYVSLDSKLNLAVVSVNDDGSKLLSGRKLRYTIYRNSYSWWWDYDNYSAFIRSMKNGKATSIVAEKTFTSGDKPYIIDYQPTESGEFFIEVEDLVTKQSAGVSLYAGDWLSSSNSRNQNLEKLKIETDKKDYKIGDKAKIVFEGDKGARALISIVKSGKVIKRYWKNMSDNKMEEQVTITKDMIPNVYFSVMVFQNYKTVTNDRPLRIYGLVPLVVKDDEQKLNIIIDAPKEIRPNSNFEIKVKNKEKVAMEYTVAIVDEGLLNMTAFQTPDPFDYFYAREKYSMILYDNYSSIMKRIYGKSYQVLTTGGDLQMLDENDTGSSKTKKLGIEDAKRFVPVAMYKGVLSLKAGEESKLSFKMPNYMGSVRVMVTGATENKFGKAEADILVKAPVLMQVGLPRTLKIGDKFRIPVTIFALEDNVGEVTISYNFQGKNKQETIKMTKKDKKVIYFEEAVANKVGIEKMEVSVASKVYNYKESVEIAVNSNSPYIYRDELKIMPNGKAEFTPPDEFVKNSVYTTLRVSNVPLLGIDKRLEYLIKYPYGCGEQITSGVFPQLFIKKLATSKTYDEQKIIENINAGIEKLSKVQTTGGAFKYWTSSDGYDLWLTNYVGHFLIMSRKNGIYVSDEMYDKFIGFLKNRVKSSSGDDLNIKTYSLYLLALNGTPEVGEMNLIFENYFNQLSLPSKWMMAASYSLIKQDKVAKKIAEILPTVFARDINYRYYYYDSDLKNKAIILSAYYKIYGKVDQKLYEEIIGELRSSSWYSTQTTAYTLISLSDIVQGKKSSEFSGTIFLDGKPSQVSSKNGTMKVKIPESVKKISLDFSKSKQQIFANYYWEGLPINYNRENVSKNFILTREYFDNDGNRISPDKIKIGTQFWIKIKAEGTSGQSVENIALTQILPTGWEIENLRLNNASYPSWISQSTAQYTDIRDDRVMWFFDSYGSRTYSFFIKVNAVTEGSFDIPGTTLEAMYDNNYEAYLNGSRVEVIK